ncbi:MAG TPA: DegT/DnrJ/EryC1/StrS family aminotransferase [Myxococcaceae bacterium]|jgi:dTDP-4-amino-4,6-dideoxygalactose transaminase
MTGPEPAVEAVIRDLPDLWPSQLLARPPEERAFPFDRPDLELCYLGRNAVHRAVRRLGLEGAGVIAPAYHHGVEIAALLHAGARVRFARVDESMRLDPEHVASLVGPRTRAIYVIHYAGFPQPLEPFLELARRHGLALIEDCALSLFSRDGDRPLGSTGDAAIFCFYKTLPVSHGGALLVRRAGAVDQAGLGALRPPPLLPTLSQLGGALLANLEAQLGAPGRAARGALKSLSSGLRRRANELAVPVGTQHFDPGVVDLGMSALLARLARAADASRIVQRRRENWSFLHQRLAGHQRAVWPRLPEGASPLFYALRVEDKDRVLRALRGRGVKAVDFWRTGHPSAGEAPFPDVERLRAQVVELPCHQDLGPDQLERVARAAREAVEDLG